MASIEHVDIDVGEIHLAHNWEYADATARGAASGFVPGDVGKLARQIDTNALWMLTDDSPATWAYIGGATAGGILDGTYPNPGLAAGVAGDGLAETSDVLSVNVDGSTIEINADALRVKDAGITVAKLATAARDTTINVVIDGGGSAITTGIKHDLVVDFAATILGVTMLADQSGSIVVDIWKCTYAQFDNSTHPVSGDKITASAPPTITTAHKSTDSTLTGWTTSISAGDVLRFNVNSAATITRVTLALKVRRA